MSSHPVKTVIQPSKSKILDQSQSSSALEQSVKLLDQLFQFRLIDKIARPIDKKVKEQYIERYRQKLNNLHDKLKKIKVQAEEKQSTEGNVVKSKSVLASTTHKPVQRSKFIRKIQSKYTEILLEGSYKYFKPICGKLSLRYDSSGMQTVNIEAWANMCLQVNSSESCC